MSSGVALIGFLVALVDGYDTLMLAFIAPLIGKEWTLPPRTIGALFASSYAGAALGATFIGIAADRYGRKTLLLASLALAGTVTVLCSRSADASQLMVMRAVAGIGLGGALPTITALTAEWSPPAQRRAAVTRMFLGFPIGAIVGGIATAAAMSVITWRAVFAGAGVCTLLLIPIVWTGVSERPSTGVGAAPRMHSRRPISDLLAKGGAISTALFCLCVFLMLLTSYFLVSWVPTVLTLNGMNSRQAAMGTVILNVGGILGTGILSFIVSRRGPLAPITVSLCLGSLLIALLGYAIVTPGMGRFVLLFAVGLLIVGAQGGIPAMCVHLYPPTVHSTAVGLSFACGRLGSISGPLIGGLLISASFGWQKLFLAAAVPALCAGVTMGALAASRRTYAANPGLPDR